MHTLDKEPVQYILIMYAVLDVKSPYLIVHTCHTTTADITRMLAYGVPFLSVTTQRYAWWEAVKRWKDEWKYAMEESGVLFVIIHGIELMPELSVANLDTLQEVHHCDMRL